MKTPSSALRKLNVLVVGSGGREHALAWKIKSSPLLGELYLADMNDDLVQIAKSKDVGLVVVGPEKPLAEGIADVFAQHGIKCIGANKKWARLESSKSFAKEFMQRHGIATARYEVVSGVDEIEGALAKFTTPPVVKADGLAAGKGVFLPKSFEGAREILLSGKYDKYVVEEFLTGAELSVMSLFNGKSLQTFVPARDYKRLRTGNEGPNTGGMGAFCPVEISPFHQAALDEYLSKLETALLADGADFVGVVYSGLMLTGDGVKVLEYNMRFGDPETQALMVHLKSDLLEIFVNAVNGETTEFEWYEGTSTCVVLASEGYPENPLKGHEIRNIDQPDVQIFHAGVKKDGEKLLTNGGRVLSVCGKAEDVYKACERIDFEGKIFRPDINPLPLREGRST
jgi:phosphoribosylamine--glycine ligase